MEVNKATLKKMNQALLHRHFHKSKMFYNCPKACGLDCTDTKCCLLLFFFSLILENSKAVFTQFELFWCSYSPNTVCQLPSFCLHKFADPTHKGHFWNVCGFLCHITALILHLLKVWWLLFEYHPVLKESDIIRWFLAGLVVAERFLFFRVTAFWKYI